mmetsp:Transcript_3659/g.5699  ORF Transcript_3659/g.5699 Transcript_3659/m.5699 type:complete len:373 (+) Transcript_3659:185-1303(+)
MCLLDYHAGVVGYLLALARVEGLRLALAPAVVWTGVVPDLSWRLLLLELHIDRKSTVGPVEAHRLAVGRARLVSINEDMQEPLHVVIDCHVALLREVTMARVAHLVAVVLHTNLDAAQVVRTLQEGAVTNLEHIDGATEHWNTDRSSQAGQPAQILAPSEQTVQHRNHWARDVCLALSPALQVDLSHQAVVEPLVAHVIIEGVVPQLCHAIFGSALRLATKREIVPKSAPDLRVDCELCCVLCSNEPIAPQLVHDELLCKLRRLTVSHWHILRQGNHLAIRGLEGVDFIAPIWAAHASTGAAGWLVVLITSALASPTRELGILRDDSRQIAPVLGDHAGAAVAVRAGDLSIVKAADLSLFPCGGGHAAVALG